MIRMILHVTARRAGTCSLLPVRAVTLGLSLKLSKNWQMHHSLSISASRKAPSVKSQVDLSRKSIQASRKQVASKSHFPKERL